ncbi:MltA-interacting MipA family protein [Deltaproteobacteria bacterium]|nr:MltA-interacting MipA family protein [Deltaproteobacteria bacterium]
MAAKRRGLFILAALAAALAWPAVPAARGEDERGFTAALGAAVLVQPEFEGSNRYEAQALPVVYLRWGRAFLSVERGLGLELDVLDNHMLTVAPALRYRLGRDQDDSELLRGLGNIDGGLEVGGTVLFQPWPGAGSPLSFNLAVYQGLGRVEGLTLELGPRYGAALTERLTGSLGAAIGLADRKYNRQRFGVTPAQSLASGYPVYDPGGGLKHAAVSGGLGYDLTEALELGLTAEYKRLTGPAADSPLVQRGSANQFRSGLSLTYNFE